jgi:hypothetical protein
MEMMPAELGGGGGIVVKTTYRGREMKRSQQFVAWAADLRAINELTNSSGFSSWRDNPSSATPRSHALRFTDGVLGLETVATADWDWDSIDALFNTRGEKAVLERFAKRGRPQTRMPPGLLVDKHGFVSTAVSEGETRPIIR